jgi:hypothetical protein
VEKYEFIKEVCDKEERIRYYVGDQLIPEANIFKYIG